ncbi:MAG: glycosyltransferase family 2 protein [Silvanigrellales bacterium]|nr:glycosyltransferase family 2 protein [Silvanigrellales bacterium]
MSLRAPVSVVVAAYNAEETLDSCLEALASQHDWRVGDDFEVIVVDDGSTDKTAELAEKHPVRLIRLNENQGRVVARETGVAAATHERVLIVDARVIVDHGLLKAQDAIEGRCLMAGDFGERELMTSSTFASRMERVFLLLRNTYYAGGYPQHVDVLEIDAKNFSRSPKGLGCARIEKSLFLKLQPEEKGKHVNDDSKLLWALVQEHSIPLKRCLALKVRYLQRTSGHSLRSWLVGRGVLFADFVFPRNVMVQALFLASWLAILAFPFLMILQPRILLVFLGAIVAGLLALGVWISKRPFDVPLLLVSLPEIGLTFWWGLSKGVWLRFCRRWRAENAPSHPQG